MSPERRKLLSACSALEAACVAVPSGTSSMSPLADRDNESHVNTVRHDILAAKNDVVRLAEAAGEHLDETMAAQTLLQDKYDKLQAAHDALRAKYDALETAHAAQKQRLSKFDATVEHLRELFGSAAL